MEKQQDNCKECGKEKCGGSDRKHHVKEENYCHGHQPTCEKCNCKIDYTALHPCGCDTKPTEGKCERGDEYHRCSALHCDYCGKCPADLKDAAHQPSPKPPEWEEGTIHDILDQVYGSVCYIYDYATFGKQKGYKVKLEDKQFDECFRDDVDQKDISNIAAALTAQLNQVNKAITKLTDESYAKGYKDGIELGTEKGRGDMMSELTLDGKLR